MPDLLEHPVWMYREVRNLLSKELGIPLHIVPAFQFLTDTQETLSLANFIVDWPDDVQIEPAPQSIVHIHVGDHKFLLSYGDQEGPYWLDLMRLPPHEVAE